MIVPMEAFLSQTSGLVPCVVGFALGGACVWKLLVPSYIRRSRQRIRQKNAALHESEERYQLAVRGSSVGLWDWNLHTNALYWSPRFKEIIGIDDANFTPHFSEFESRLHPEDRERIIEAVNLHLLEKKPYDVEYRIRRQDGSYVWAHARGQAIWDESGKPIRMAGSVDDITQRRQAEQALLESERRLQSVIDNSGDGLITIDQQGAIQIFNPACEKIFGYSGAEVIGRNVNMLMPLPHTNQHDGYLANHAAYGGNRVVGVLREFEAIHKDGTIFPIEIAITEMRLQGKPGYTAAIRDITGRKQQEAALKASEETFRLAMEHASIGMALLSTEGRFLVVNKALCDITGYPKDELLKTDFQTITHPDDLELDLEYARQLLSGAIATYRMEKRYIRKDGGIVWILLCGSVVRKPDGSPDYCIAQIQDITDLKNAQKQREQFIGELTAVNEQLEQFAYVASHDLREPIRTLFSFASLLEEEYGGKIDGQGLEYLAIMRGAAQKMGAMVADLLEYARLTQDAKRFSEIDCNVKLAHTLEMLSESIESTNAIIETAPLPQVTANAPRFIRLLQNLIGNGLKYQPPGNTPVIRISAEDIGDAWEFAVADNGIGISPEFQQDIFLPFRRLHNQSEYAGSGIGLAICKRIVESFGGKLRVESSPGNGSTFFFTIPKQAAQQIAA